MLVVHASFPVDGEAHDEATEAARSLAEASREEDGILEYRVAEDIEDAGLLRFTEVYEGEEDFGEHSESEHFREFEGKLPGFLAGEPKVVRYEVSDRETVEL